MQQPTDPTPDPEFASGADTLIGVLASAAKDGYRAEFRVESGGKFVCGVCDNWTPSAALRVDRYVRLEGASDAADLMLVALARCPVCQLAGAITLGYGPNAGEHDDEFIAALDLRDVPAGFER